MRDKNISVPSFYLYLPRWRQTGKTAIFPWFLYFILSWVTQHLLSSQDRNYYLTPVVDLFSIWYAIYCYFLKSRCKVCSIKKLVKQKKKIKKKTHKSSVMSPPEIANGNIWFGLPVFFFFFFVYSSSLPGLPSFFYLHTFSRWYPPGMPIIHPPQSRLSLFFKTLQFKTTHAFLLHFE